MYLSNGAGGGNEGRIYDDLEGQLFGPLPPYLSQGQNEFGGMQGTGFVPGGMQGQDMGFHTGMTPGEDMTGNFDIFSGEGGDWGDVLHGQGYRQ